MAGLPAVSEAVQEFAIVLDDVSDCIVERVQLLVATGHRLCGALRARAFRPPLVSTALRLGHEHIFSQWVCCHQALTSPSSRGQVPTSEVVDGGANKFHEFVKSSGPDDACTVVAGPPGGRSRTPSRLR